MNAREEGKFRKASEEANRQEVEMISTTILEMGDAESVSEKNLACDFTSKEESAISENFEMRGGRSNHSGQLDTDERSSVNAELGGGGVGGRRQRG